MAGQDQAEETIDTLGSLVDKLGLRRLPGRQVRAWPVPSANTGASSIHGVTSPAIASRPSAAAASSMTACVTSRNRRRSTR
jgi:hypothetical protein